jgi:Glyoxalase/Bleomycin resistance protein/Dioxygenase superfamily
MAKRAAKIPERVRPLNLALDRENVRLTAMKHGATMRVARPTDNLAAIAEMYAQGLGFTVLAEFQDHRGFDGIILGHRKQPYHLEFTSQRGHQVGKAPTQDHLLVFYIPDQDDWEAGCAQMESAGFREVPSYNPYWEVQGKTFEDLDGYRVVLQHEAWTK